MQNNDNVKLVGEDIFVPRVRRPKGSKARDVYEITLAESDLLFIVEGITTQMNRLRHNLGKCNFDINAPTSLAEGEENWTSEDAVFLADGLARLARLHNEALYLVHNPDAERY